MIRKLTLDEEHALSSGLALAAACIGTPAPWTAGQVQGLYDELRRTSGSTEVAIAAGLAFGDLLRQLRALDWIRIDDEFGSETCLISKTHQAYCAPISIIDKRLGREEDVDLEELSRGVVTAVDDMATRAARREFETE